MKYYMWGRKTETRAVQRIGGPYLSVEIAQHEAGTARLDGYIDVFIGRLAPKPRRNSGARRDSRRS